MLGTRSRVAAKLISMASLGSRMLRRTLDGMGAKLDCTLTCKRPDNCLVDC